MEVAVQNGANPTPFLQARDRFETEFDIERPVKVFVRSDPYQRTVTAHYPTYHTLSMSAIAANSEMAAQLTLHEFAHMVRYEQGHMSHHSSTIEGLYLAAGGRSVSEDRLAHCLQIANHLKDIYADDLTIEVSVPTRLVDFFEASLATTLINRESGSPPRGGNRVTRQNDKAIAAINAAFAIALLDRHDLLPNNHRLFQFADTIASDAPMVPFDHFRTLFYSLEENPTASEYRRVLVDAFSTYLEHC